MAADGDSQYRRALESEDDNGAIALLPGVRMHNWALRLAVHERRAAVVQHLLVWEGSAVDLAREEADDLLRTAVVSDNAEVVGLLLGLTPAAPSTDVVLAALQYGCAAALNGLLADPRAQPDLVTPAAWHARTYHKRVGPRQYAAIQALVSARAPGEETDVFAGIAAEGQAG